MHDNPKISIGLPVYNGENFLRKRLDSLLSQTYSNFEIIISDNASTDSTPNICKKYAKDDNKRIRYFRQKKNLGWHQNFKFVLEQAKCEYFVWTAVNDIWDKTFLEKNLKILIEDPDVVGSISKMIRYGGKRKERELSMNPLIKKIVNELRQGFSHYGTFPTHGNYESRVRTYLGANCAESIYALYRTGSLKRSFVDESIASVDLAIILKVLKYGDLHVINEVLFEDYTGGITSKGILNTYKGIRKSSFEILFPYHSFNKWCFKNLGPSIFFKNLDKLINLNFGGFLAVIYDFLLQSK